MIQKETLLELCNLTAQNFQFEIDGFGTILDTLLKNLKEYSEDEIRKGFERIWTITNEQWNQEFGYRGYPSLARWFELITGKRILTQEELQEKKREYEESIQFYVAIIDHWLDDRNLEISFIEKYKNKNNKHLRKIIDSYLKLKEELTDERVVKMGVYLKKVKDSNRDQFMGDLKGIAKQTNRFLLENSGA